MMTSMLRFFHGLQADLAKIYHSGVPRTLHKFRGRTHLEYHRSLSVQRKYHICVVGSGPAGFYTAQSLLKNNPNVTVDILEKLPVPFGLVRYGVAPDHPEVKNVINQFSSLAQSGQCSFLGNINIGTDVTVKELLDAYSAVVLSYGAASDRRLNIPGEDLEGVVSARNFVGWYNGLPQDSKLTPNLDTETAVVIGQGNVALDVARILLTPIEILQVKYTLDEDLLEHIKMNTFHYCRLGKRISVDKTGWLKGSTDLCEPYSKTDISENALSALRRSKVKQVYLVGRRGPLEVSFTIKELREMIKLPGTRPLLDSSNFDGLDKLIPGLPRGRKRLIELLHKTALNAQTLPNENFQESSSIWGLKFLLSPLEIVSDQHNQKVQGVKFGVNSLQSQDGQTIPVPTGEEEFIKCGLVLKSIGYKSVTLDPIVPFDHKNGIVRNTKGKVDGLKGLYCSGWVKRGAVGVILSSLNDSIETARTILNDIESGDIQQMHNKESNYLINLLNSRGVQPVTFQDWLNIDEEERVRGQLRSKPREKISDIKEMLNIAFKSKPGK